MSLIREKYIPYLVTEAAKEEIPVTTEELVDFCVALYDQIKIMEKQLVVNVAKMN